MRYIQLTQGKAALVDDEDFEKIIQSNWFFSNGYAAKHRGRWPKQKIIYMHREIMNPRHKLEIDHINMDKLDNRRANLRICTRSQNAANSNTKIRSASGYRGLRWRKDIRKWQVCIIKDRKAYNLGVFTDAKEAAHAYDKAAKQLFGYFANLNFPD